MYGCEIVCFAPIGRAPVPYAFAVYMAGTKRCRGTSRIACSTRSSRTPRAATSFTIFARRCARAASSFRGAAGKEFLERLEPRNRLVMGQIEMERRDRDVAVLD